MNEGERMLVDCFTHQRHPAWSSWRVVMDGIAPTDRDLPWGVAPTDRGKFMRHEHPTLTTEPIPGLSPNLLVWTGRHHKFALEFRPT